MCHGSFLEWRPNPVPAFCTAQPNVSLPLGQTRPSKDGPCIRVFIISHLVLPGIPYETLARRRPHMKSVPFRADRIPAICSTPAAVVGIDSTLAWQPDGATRSHGRAYEPWILYSTVYTGHTHCNQKIVLLDIPPLPSVPTPPDDNGTAMNSAH